MTRQLTPKSSLDNLKREAKRWLHALRDGDPEARARLDRALPNAPASPSLRDVQHALAREFGFPGWTALKTKVAEHAPANAEHNERVAWFIQNACPDHHIRGRPAHVRALHIAHRLLERHPEIARDSFYTAIVCGDVERVGQELVERPAMASEKGEPKGWEPILYLCFTRLSLSGANENALAIAGMLLDRGADPNVHFAAGGSAYTPLVGAVGEGEEDRPPHPRRDELVSLLLERGANPYDIQVIYNTGFHGQMLWYLQMIHEHTVKQGRAADWADPEWMMLGMGGYGSGARWMLNIAVRDRNMELADWALSHGANPNAGPPRSNLMLQRPLYEGALLSGTRRWRAAASLRCGAARGTTGWPRRLLCSSASSRRPRGAEAGGTASRVPESAGANVDRGKARPCGRRAAPARCWRVSGCRDRQRGARPSRCRVCQRVRRSQAAARSWRDRRPGEYRVGQHAARRGRVRPASADDRPSRTREPRHLGAGVHRKPRAAS